MLTGPLVRRHPRAGRWPSTSMRPDVGRLEAGDRAQQRGLAAARRAEQREELVVGDVERDAVQGDRVAVDGADAVDAEQGCGGHFGVPVSRVRRCADDHRDDAHEQQDGGEGVHLGGHPEAHHRVDDDRQGRLGRRRGEERDHELVDREREREQGARDDARGELRQRDPHERAHRPGTEVARRLLEARVEVRHARQHDRRDERGARTPRARGSPSAGPSVIDSSEKNVSRPMPSSRSGRMAGAIANARIEAAARVVLDAVGEQRAEHGRDRGGAGRDDERVARPCMICSSANSSGYQRSEKPRHTKRFSESLKLMITTTRIGR